MRPILSRFLVGVALAGAASAAWSAPPPPPVPCPEPATTLVDSPRIRRATPPPDPAPTPAPEPADDPESAKAVITLWDGSPVPKEWPVGFSIGLSASKSRAGAKLRSIRWSVDPAWIDPLSQRSADGRSISVGAGTRPKTVKVTLKVALGDTLDETTVSIPFVINPEDPDPQPDPGPGPVPGPGPGPGPLPVPPDPKPNPDGTFNFRAAGAAWPRSLAKTFLDSFATAAEEMYPAAGDGLFSELKPIDKVKADHIARFAASRDDAFGRLVESAFDAIIPPGTAKPSGEQRKRYADAMRAIVAGGREAIR